MTAIGILQIVLYIVILLLIVKPLGWYMARVYMGKSCGVDRVLAPAEQFFYRVCNINPKQSMDWKNYLSPHVSF